MKLRTIEVEGIRLSVSSDGSQVWREQRQDKLGRIWKRRKLTPAPHVTEDIEPPYYLRVGIGTGKHELVHRLVAQAFLPEWDEGMKVDHKNGTKDDNRIENLRIRTHPGNLKGARKATKNATSRYRGVSWMTARGKWKAQIKIGGGRGEYLGLFTCEIEAAKAYDRAAIQHGFEREALNFPEA